MKRLLVLLAALPFLSFTGNPPAIDIDYIKSDVDYLVNIYKEFHRRPEISLQENETSAKLADELRKVGFEVTENFGGYGVVGIMKNGDGPQILYRTDMDALPMFEKTELPYASELEVNYNGIQVGTMHSCGHDMHMSTWLGTARAMAANRDQWSGTLMMIGQPAEEIGRGAKLMLDEGLYETFGVPDYGLGIHASPTLPAGTIGLQSGYIMANAESIDINVFGVGAHGASPHMSIDPIVVASMIVMDIQTIASRNVKPIDDVVVTVGLIKGGTKHNIIPDQATLQLTVRTFKEEVRQLVHRRVKEISRGIGIAAGLPEDKLPEVIISKGYTPANYNDEVLTEAVKVSAAKVIGDDMIHPAEPQMVGEDFARFGRTKEDVPTVMFWLGSVPEERMKSGDLPGLHSPFYYPEPAKTLETGVSVMSQALLDLFAKGA
ncbi:MAG: amidohydrolase [Bacteroidota bacterium]